MTKVHTRLMNLSFWLVKGLPEHGLLSTDGQPSLKWRYNSLICVMLVELSPNARRTFCTVSTCILPSFWQNLMRYHCLSHSIISQLLKIWWSFTTLSLTGYLPVTDILCWQGEIVHEGSAGERYLCLCSQEKLRSDTFWGKVHLQKPNESRSQFKKSVVK